MKFLERWNQLSTLNKFGLVGSIASIIGVALWFLPNQSISQTPSVSATGDRSQAAGRDINNYRDPETLEKLEKINKSRSREEEERYRQQVRETEDGLDFFTSGDLNLKKESMEYQLNVLDKLGRKEGIAKGYLTLGAIAQKQGQMQLAEQYWNKSLTLYNELGISHMIRRMEERLQTLKLSSN